MREPKPVYVDLGAAGDLPPDQRSARPPRSGWSERLGLSGATRRGGTAGDGDDRADHDEPIPYRPDDATLVMQQPTAVERRSMNPWLARLWVFHFVVVGWIFFRARDLGDRHQLPGQPGHQLGDRHAGHLDGAARDRRRAWSVSSCPRRVGDALEFRVSKLPPMVLAVGIGLWLVVDQPVGPPGRRPVHLLPVLIVDGRRDPPRVTPPEPPEGRGRTPARTRRAGGPPRTGVPTAPAASSTQGALDPARTDRLEGPGRRARGLRRAGVGEHGDLGAGHAAGVAAHASRSGSPGAIDRVANLLVAEPPLRLGGGSSSGSTRATRTSSSPTLRSADAGARRDDHHPAAGARADRRRPAATGRRGRLDREVPRRRADRRHERHARGGDHQRGHRVDRARSVGLLQLGRARWPRSSTPTSPEVVVFMVGANDGQSILDGDGTVVAQFDTPEWEPRPTASGWRGSWTWSAATAVGWSGSGEPNVGTGNVQQAVRDRQPARPGGGGDAARGSPTSTSPGCSPGPTAASRSTSRCPTARPPAATRATACT